MSRCLHRILNTHWFYREKFPGQKDRPCSFRARRDGYCFRHHPADQKRALECKRVQIMEQLATVDAELARITPPDGAGNPS